MNITHYFHRLRLEGGGPVRGVLDLSAALHARGHRVTILTCDAADAPDEWKHDDGAVPRLRTLPPAGLLGGLFTPAQTRRLADALRESDVVHLHGVWTPSNTQVAAACRRAGIPYVWSIRGTLDDWCMGERALKKRLFLAAGASRALAGAAAIHLTAEDELRQAGRWFPRELGVVIPNLLDLEPFRSLPGPGPAREQFPQIDPARPTVLFLSRVHYKKGVPLLIDAAADLIASGTDLTVLIAGNAEEAYLDRLRAHVARRGVESRVHLIGFVSGTLKLSLYQAADLFVLPTSQENFGFVLFESLACATPLVTTRGVDTWPELVESGGGVIVDASAPAISDAIRDLLADRSRLRSMGEAGRRWVFDRLEPGAILARFEAMYALAIGR
ncbi:MAG TPA: glycosyltransferase [Phycisphaerales bacterium]|nr:glycosyltransferase [Phycisphaerales bacterium]